MMEVLRIEGGAKKKVKTKNYLLLSEYLPRIKLLRRKGAALPK